MFTLSFMQADAIQADFLVCEDQRSKDARALLDTVPSTGP